MVHLELAYAKKCGLPNYSSHQCSVSLKTELASIDQLDAQCRDLYQRLQATVDRELQTPGWLPGEESGAPACNGANGIHQNPGSEERVVAHQNGVPWQCSEKQRALIERIIDENNVDWGELHVLATKRFSKPVIALNKLEASGIIDEILERYGRNGSSNGNGRGSFRSRARNGNGRGVHA